MSFCLRCYGFYELFDKSFNEFDIWQVAFLGQSPIENGTMGFSSDFIFMLNSLV